MTDRAHCYRLIQDAAGDLQPNSVVRVLQPATETLIADPLYPGNDGITPMTNPFVSVDGSIDFYLDLPQRVRLGVTRPGSDEVFYEATDILLDTNSSFDQNHTGAGTNSMAIGSGALSPGTGAVALGNTAQANNSEATSVGHTADADAQDSTAVGSGSLSTGTGATTVGKGATGTATSVVAVGKLSAATANNAVAVGDTTTVSSQRGTALGAGSSVAHTHSTAVGSQAATSEAQQIKLGQVTDFVDVPNFLTLKSNPGLVKYRLYIRDDGLLAIRYHFPLDSVNMLTTGSHDDDFEGSNGSWTVTTGSVANSSTFKYAGSNSMKVTQSGSGTLIESLKATPAVEAHTYVGKIWAFRHLAEGSATEPTAFQASLRFFDGSNVLIGSATSGPSQTIVPDIWMPVDVRGVAPATTAKVALRLTVTGGASPGVWYVDSAGIFDIPTGT